MLRTNLLYQPVDRLSGFANHIVEQEEQDARREHAEKGFERLRRFFEEGKGETEVNRESCEGSEEDNGSCRHKLLPSLLPRLLMTAHALSLSSLIMDERHGI